MSIGSKRSRRTRLAAADAARDRQANHPSYRLPALAGGLRRDAAGVDYPKVRRRSIRGRHPASRSSVAICSLS